MAASIEVEIEHRRYVELCPAVRRAQGRLGITTLEPGQHRAQIKLFAATFSGRTLIETIDVNALPAYEDRLVPMQLTGVVRRGGTLHVRLYVEGSLFLERMVPVGRYIRPSNVQIAALVLALLVLLGGLGTLFISRFQADVYSPDTVSDSDESAARDDAAGDDRAQPGDRGSDEGGDSAAAEASDDADDTDERDDAGAESTEGRDAGTGEDDTDDTDAADYTDERDNTDDAVDTDEPDGAEDTGPQDAGAAGDDTADDDTADDDTTNDEPAQVAGTDGEQAGEAVSEQPDAVEPRTHIVYFNPESASLTDDTLEALSDIADRLSGHDLQVRVDGHTAIAGSMEGRVQLSRRRAEAVREYLVGEGIDPERFSELNAFGAARPVTRDLDDQDRNRRVEIIEIEDGQ